MLEPDRFYAPFAGAMIAGKVLIMTDNVAPPVNPAAGWPAAWPWLGAYPAGIDWHAPLAPVPAWEILDRAVAANGDKPALDFMGRRTRYAELGRQVDAVAAGLQALGLVKGDRVGLFLPNCPSFVILYFAILKAGGTVVNFNPLYAPPQVAHQVEDSGVRFMATFDRKILCDKLLPLLGTAKLEKLIVCDLAAALPFMKGLALRLLKGGERATLNDKRIVPFGALLKTRALPLPVAVEPMTDIAVLQYTGGTTGTPKGAMLSHANVAINAQQCKLWFSPTQGADTAQEKMLAVIPLFHCFAMTAVMNLGLALGAEIILLPRFEIGELIRTITTKRPTLFPAVATIYSAINAYKGTAAADLRSIKYCISGGAPLPVAVKEKFESLTGCRLVEGYGLTEASPVTHAGPLVGGEKTGTIGLPLPGTIAEIVSLDDHLTVLPPGERGELCIRGPQVMLGYWQAPLETAKTIVAGRLYTGDVGVMDEDGYVTIVDRIKDMIIAGGYNIYPKNVEATLYAHPAIADAVVAGVTDAYRGETVKAWVQLKAGATLTESELREFLKERLSPIETPKKIEFRDSLPKTLIGKLDRRALVEAEKI